ncbi:unnamed protein product [Cylicostephanus goldi]|uniref:Peptidase A1 domain-containing protein n=1 Tax=Cylicostephanus goldi TaxID=71465 RepID=A0A3P7LXN1_CYLGO|nr:unnamed protein product [Cylicostephanus goldi]
MPYVQNVCVSLNICRTATCTSRTQFDPAKSQTFVNVSGTWNQDTHGAVNGVQGRDTVRVGSTGETQLLASCIFGMATTVSDQFGTAMSGYDGMLGLGVNPSSGIPSDPFLVQLDKSKTLDRTMFTVYMNKNSLTQGAKAGSVTYGATDSINCLSNPKYYKLSSNTFIQLKVNKTSITYNMIPTFFDEAWKKPNTQCCGP